MKNDIHEINAKVIESPKIIIVKEYLNGSNQQTTRNSISRIESLDDRVSLSPSYLEDNVSVRSFQSVLDQYQENDNDKL